MLKYRVTPWLLTPVLAWLLGCGDSGGKAEETTGTNDGTTTESSAECLEDAMRCAAEQFAQKCVFGRWADWSDCGAKGQSCVMSEGMAVCEDEADTGETDTGETDTGETDTGETDTGETDTGETDTGWDTSTDAHCSGLPDFTACEVVTSPDRSYDICVSALCISPGCGDASCNVPGPHFPLADTNQRLCYNDSGPVTCPSAGQNYYGQDAQYGWDATHLESARYTRTTPVTNQPIVEDNVTGLVWQGCSAGFSGTDCATGSASEATWSDALVTCDSLTWGGYVDWRLPDPYELASIVDSGGVNPAIDPVAFPGTQDGVFWASSSFANNSGEAWSVYSNSGHVVYDDKVVGSRVRCVRSGPFHARRFEPLTLLDARMVSDNVTGLEWPGCAAGLSGATCAEGSATFYTWSAALSYCEGLSYGGHTDWRLPNRAELQSIVDQRALNPAIDAVAFPGAPSDGFWSSSSDANDSYRAWGAHFNDGYVSFVAKSSDYMARCVRSGQ